MRLKQIFLNIVPDNIVSAVEPIYYKLQLLYSKFRWVLFGRKVLPKDIPIVINNFNRLEYLKKLISSLQSRGYTNIYVLDNDSTYPPLLEFYKNTDVNVIYLGKNYGFRAIWESGIVKKFWDSYYVYTDSDIELIQECPSNFMEYFIELLEKYPNCHKVGFGIRIDDLPDYFKNKAQVIEHEKQFWVSQISSGLYNAPIDTTFAVYRPYTGTSTNFNKLNIRTGFPYLIKHLPWYTDSNNLSKEDLFYINAINKTTHWSSIMKSNDSK